MAQDNDFQFYDKDGELINMKALFEFGVHHLNTIGISSEHQRIHSGQAFLAGFGALHGSELADDASTEILVQVGADTGAHLIRAVSASGDCEIFITEGVAFTGAGTSLTVFNKDRNNVTDVTTLTATHTPAGVTGGTALPTKFLPGGPGKGSGGQDGSYDREIILKKSTDYSFKVTNRSGAVMLLSDILEWYEPRSILHYRG
jgi:hypothetical protein